MGKCGRSALMGRVKRDRQDTDTVLAYLSKSKKRAIETYEDCVEQGIDAGSRPELVGGGLIRNCGGWSYVLSLQWVGSKVFSDERIVASSDFASNSITDAEKKAKDTVRLTMKIVALPSLAQTVGEGEGTDQTALHPGMRKKQVVK
jgi:putative transposase